MQAIVMSPADMGRIVRLVRNQHGLTQREIAVRLGVSQRWYSELESGKGKQANERYFEILALLGIRLTAEIDVEVGGGETRGTTHVNADSEGAVGGEWHD